MKVYCCVFKSVIKANSVIKVYWCYVEWIQLYWYFSTKFDNFSTKNQSFQIFPRSKHTAHNVPIGLVYYWFWIIKLITSINRKKIKKQLDCKNSWTNIFFPKTVEIGGISWVKWNFTRINRTIFFHCD